MRKIAAVLSAVALAATITLSTTGAASRRFTCPSPPNATGCFYANNDFTGPVYQAHPSGGEEQWRLIPSDNRGSETNHTNDAMWLYAKTGLAAGTYDCLTPDDRHQNNNVRGYFYYDTTNTCNNAAPNPPN